jgi:hypothetical protein
MYRKKKFAEYRREWRKGNGRMHINTTDVNGGNKKFKQLTRVNPLKHCGIVCTTSLNIKNL